MSSEEEYDSSSSDEDTFFCLIVKCKEEFDSRYEQLDHIFNIHHKEARRILTSFDVDFYNEQRKRRGLGPVSIDFEKKTEKNEVVVEDDARSSTSSSDYFSSDSDSDDGRFYCFVDFCDDGPWEKEVEFVRHIMKKHPKLKKRLTKKQIEMSECFEKVDEEIISGDSDDGFHSEKNSSTISTSSAYSLESEFGKVDDFLEEEDSDRFGNNDFLSDLSSDFLDPDLNGELEEEFLSRSNSEGFDSPLASPTSSSPSPTESIKLWDYRWKAGRKMSVRDLAIFYDFVPPLNFLVPPVVQRARDTMEYTSLFQRKPSNVNLMEDGLTLDPPVVPISSVENSGGVGLLFPSFLDFLRLLFKGTDYPTERHKYMGYLLSFGDDYIGASKKQRTRPRSKLKKSESSAEEEFINLRNSSSDSDSDLESDFLKKKKVKEDVDIWMNGHSDNVSGGSIFSFETFQFLVFLVAIGLFIFAKEILKLSMTWIIIFGLNEKEFDFKMLLLGMSGFLNIVINPFVVQINRYILKYFNIVRYLTFLILVYCVMCFAIIPVYSKLWKDHVLWTLIFSFIVKLINGIFGGITEPLQKFIPFSILYSTRGQMELPNFFSSSSLFLRIRRVQYIMKIIFKFCSLLSAVIFVIILKYYDYQILLQVIPLSCCLSLFFMFLLFCVPFRKNLFFEFEKMEKNIRDFELPLISKKSKHLENDEDMEIKNAMELNKEMLESNGMNRKRSNFRIYAFFDHRLNFLVFSLIFPLACYHYCSWVFFPYYSFEYLGEKLNIGVFHGASKFGEIIGVIITITLYFMKFNKLGNKEASYRYFGYRSGSIVFLVLGTLFTISLWIFPLIPMYGVSEIVEDFGEMFTYVVTSVVVILYSSFYYCLEDSLAEYLRFRVYNIFPNSNRKDEIFSDVLFSFYIVYVLIFWILFFAGGLIMGNLVSWDENLSLVLVIGIIIIFGSIIPLIGGYFGVFNVGKNGDTDELIQNIKYEEKRANMIMEWKYFRPFIPIRMISTVYSLQENFYEFIVPEPEPDCNDIRE